MTRLHLFAVTGLRTREALLECTNGKDDDEVTWQVVDSPLLNRGTSLDWFGWPLAAEPQDPQDMMPMSRQIAQTSRGDQPGFSLQIEFEGNRFAEAPRALLVHDDGYRFTTREGQAVIGTVEGAKLKTAGLRVGVYHKLAAYGAGKPVVELAPPKPRCDNCCRGYTRPWINTSQRATRPSLPEASALRPLKKLDFQTNGMDQNPPDTSPQGRVRNAK